MELNITSVDKILVVAPHQDDETIGCGGLLAKYGSQCDVLLLTNGIYEMKGYQKKDIQAIRDSELEKAMQLANINQIFKLNIENGKVKQNYDKIKCFNITKYNYIFVPNAYEAQDDHCIVLKMMKKMIFSQKSKAKLLEYEVWTPLRYPTTLLDISAVIDIKKKMIKAYKSQLKQKDYYESALGLNKYRGMHANVDYAEAYMDANYSGIKRVVYEKMPNSIKILIKKIIA